MLTASSLCGFRCCMGESKESNLGSQKVISMDALECLSHDTRVLLDSNQQLEAKLKEKTVEVDSLTKKITELEAKGKQAADALHARDEADAKAIRTRLVDSKLYKEEDVKDRTLPELQLIADAADRMMPGVASEKPVRSPVGVNADSRDSRFTIGSLITRSKPVVT